MVLTFARDVRLYNQKLRKKNSEMIIADSLGCCVFSAFYISYGVIIRGGLFIAYRHL